MQYHLTINAQDVLCVTGKLYMRDAVAACARGKELIDTLATVKVDLSGVEDADSGCLAMLIEWLRVAKTQQKDIVFNNLPQFMLDLGRVCGLDTVLPIEREMKFN
jgi:phospholipid transport system transporter-binding protein